MRKPFLMSLRCSLALELSLFWSPGPHFSIFVKPESGCWLLHLRPVFLTQRSPGALSSQCCRDEPLTYGWQQLVSLLTLSWVWYWLQQPVQELLVLPRGLAGFLARQSLTSCLSPPLFPDPLLLLLSRILAQEFLAQSSCLGRSQLSKPVTR